jgi:hypothetical protein
MNIIHTPQFTLQLESALRHMVRENGSMSIGRAEALYRTPHGALKQWFDTFNSGNLKISNNRIDEVKKEVGAIVVTRIAAPTRPITPKPAAADDDEIPKAKAPVHVQFVGRVDRVRAAASKLAPAALPPKAAAGPVGTEDFLHWLNNQGILGEAKAVTSYLVRISPATASSWLKLNKGNRVPSNAKIRRFAAQMRDRLWKENGETIKFSKTGRLIDGQSRLMAIVSSGRDIVLEVRGGLEDDVQATMDVGQQRSNRHTMEMKGERYPALLAPALKMCRLLERGTLGSHSKSDTIVENYELGPTLERHPKIRDSVSKCSSGYRGIDQVMPISRATFFHYTFGQLDAKLRDAFFDNLVLIRKDKPTVIELRRRLVADKKEGLSKNRANDHFRRTIMTWNNLRGGPAVPLEMDTHAPYPEIR